MDVRKKEQYRRRVLEYYDRAGIVLSETERETLEVTDFGLGDFERTGLSLVVYVNNEKYCAKEMAMLPFQTCPEHRHAPMQNYPGKQETFRCRYGIVYLYVEGTAAAQPRASAPAGNEAYYTAWHEIVLHPGEQYTILPNTRHWFQAGKEGAVVSEFSTQSFDEYDLFTDPNIVRVEETENEAD